MLFNEDIIAQIEENPVMGITNACEVAIDRLNELSGDGWSEIAHELLMEAVSFLELAIQTSQIHVDAIVPEAAGNIQENCKNFWVYICEIKAIFEEQSIKLKMDSYKARYKADFKASFSYEFSQGDLERIQTLINELRDHISENEMLEEDHKRRLLKRLESMQSELHKRVSDLDRLWGMVGDAGVVLGKLGVDSKPIVDRIKEVTEIVWKTQSRTEELPSDSRNPMIEYDDDT